MSGVSMHVRKARRVLRATRGALADTGVKSRLCTIKDYSVRADGIDRSLLDGTHLRLPGRLFSSPLSRRRVMHITGLLKAQVTSPVGWHTQRPECLMARVRL